MNKDIQIRLATNADSKEIQELNILAQQDQGIYPEDKWYRPDIDDLEEFYFNNGGFFLVAEKQGNIIGCGGVRMLSPTAGYVLRTRVHPDEQNKGCGTLLMKNIIKRAQDDDRYNWLWLDVRKEQESAIHLYTKLGFVCLCEVYIDECLLMQLGVQSK